MSLGRNLHEATVEGFGEEWSTFDQMRLDGAEREKLFGEYFAVFPWNELPEDAVGADIGCGSGRWARLVVSRVGALTCVDASNAALAVAREALADASNCSFAHASVDNLPFEPASLDFAYSLGVLHHVPDTRGALRACAQVLKPGAPFLVYLYYALDGRPRWYRALWKASDVVRRCVSRLPHRLRLAVSAIAAVAVYMPLARAAKVTARLGRNADGMPLAYYRDRSFYTMRTDAYDRLGTQLEQRFTREEIQRMLADAGFVEVEFSDSPPFWCAVGRRAA
ncbi:MAG: class I SAM-dependent methyltransferase [Actinomycetota bacterium]|nr:class I SAM-dependent methyltransferase [Actinomycetota bacterium]